MKTAFPVPDLFEDKLFHDPIKIAEDLAEVLFDSDLPTDVLPMGPVQATEVRDLFQDYAPGERTSRFEFEEEDDFSFGVTAIEWDIENISAKGGGKGKPSDSTTDPDDTTDEGGSNGGGGGGNGGGRGKPAPSDPVILTDGENYTLPTGAADPSGLTYFSDEGGARSGTLQETLAGFDIAISFLGDWSSTLAETWSTALIRSADFFTSFITEGLYVNEGSFADSAITDGSAWWDDLLIEVSFGDLAPGALASAGPSDFWPVNSDGDYMPAKGSMTIDTDIQDISLENATLIATHEMMHVLGVGTIWGQSSIFTPWNHDLVASDGSYLGLAANEVYASEFEADDGGPLPALAVENDGGSGTAGGHWETDLLVNAVTTPGDGTTSYTDDFAYELMTGWIDLSNPQEAYLSDTSLAVLEDLGYTVDWNVDYQYDDYSFGLA